MEFELRMSTFDSTFTRYKNSRENPRAKSVRGMTEQNYETKMLSINKQTTAMEIAE
jgi:hypothetical protein